MIQTPRAVEGTPSACILIDSDDDYEPNDAKSRWSFDDTLKFAESSDWISITVEDPGKHSKIDILDGILHCTSPAEFIPVFFEGDRFPKKFYVTNCEEAIKKICRRGFTCYCVNDPIYLKVTHNDPPKKKINHLKIIQDALRLRFTTANNELDLTNFAEDFLFLDKIYFPLWYERNQGLVTFLVENLSLSPNVHILNLSSNSLRSITAFNIPDAFSSIHTLNLSNNLLENIRTLWIQTGPSNNITSLWLDGNDMCQKFTTATSYVENIKAIFPAVTRLDGQLLCVNGFPAVQRNFVINHDCMSLVNKFMEIFFVLVDSDERDLLAGMYTKNAILTISCELLTGTSFHKKSRNILAKSKLRGQDVFIGPQDIVTCFKSLPRTEHDPLSFTVDVTSHSIQTTVIHITGVFKMPSSSLAQEPCFEFMRTFILMQVDDTYCYKITNDMLNISSKMTSTPRKAFLTAKFNNKLMLTVSDPSALEPTVKDGIINLFVKLTELSHLDAQICLDKNRWNFRSALLDGLTLINKNISYNDLQFQ